MYCNKTDVKYKSSNTLVIYMKQTLLSVYLAVDDKHTNLYTCSFLTILEDVHDWSWRSYEVILVMYVYNTNWVPCVYKFKDWSVFNYVNTRDLKD